MLSDAYCHEVILIQKLLHVMHEICGEFFIFQQFSVPAHRAPGTINLLKRDTCVHFTRPFAIWVRSAILEVRHSGVLLLQ